MNGTDHAFACASPSCNARFPVVDGVPILIDEANSLFSFDSYLNRSEIFFRKHGRLVTSITKRLPRIGQNLEAPTNYKRFAELLTAQGDGIAQVLVIGGGVQGMGME